MPGRFNSQNVLWCLEDHTICSHSRHH